MVQIAYTVRKSDVEIDGWGAAVKLELLAHSDDGELLEFVGEFLSPDDADRVAALWLDSEQRWLFYLLAVNVRLCGFG